MSHKNIDQMDMHYCRYDIVLAVQLFGKVIGFLVNLFGKIKTIILFKIIGVDIK